MTTCTINYRNLLTIRIILFQQYYTISLPKLSSPQNFCSPLTELEDLRESQLNIHSKDQYLPSYIQATYTVINSRTLQIYTD